MTSQRYESNDIHLFESNVLPLYSTWPSPDVIVSDGGYGVSGFKGDANSPRQLQDWYRPHIEKWSQLSNPGTTLWFWNTEIGWANVHPLLDKMGWEYVGCNIWNKGIQHIAGNCNLPVLKGFPVVTEVCVHYVRRAEFMAEGSSISLKQWLRREWERTGLPLYKTNEACGVANAATRKYFTKDHLWYAPPPEMFSRIVKFANRHGHPDGAPYFSLDGSSPGTVEQYARLFATFDGKYGITNVWDHPPLHNGERVRIPGSTRYAHLNQKPLELVSLIVDVSSRPGDVIWEPFGGLCTAAIACSLLGRVAYSAELDHTLFSAAEARLQRYIETPPLEQLQFLSERKKSMESFIVA